MPTSIALGLMPVAHGHPTENGNLEMLQMTTQQIDDRETVDGVEAVRELANRNSRNAVQMAGLAQHRQLTVHRSRTRIGSASISRRVLSWDGKAQPALRRHRQQTTPGSTCPWPSPRW